MSEERVTAQQRRLVTARANGTCEYCQSQAQFATQAFSVEHIIPRFKNGKTALDNLALSCQGCNNHKHTKTEAIDSITEQVVPLYNPRWQSWKDHFAWSDDYTSIVGLTPTGRATVDALHLNRSSLVNLRRALFAFGSHPPQESIPEADSYL